MTTSVKPISYANSRALLVAKASISIAWRSWGTRVAMAAITKLASSRTMTPRPEQFSLTNVASLKLILYEPGSGGFHLTLLTVL